ncbi:hypothetical protein [Mycobacterium sp.]
MLHLQLLLKLKLKLSGTEHATSTDTQAGRPIDSRWHHVSAAGA